MGRSETQYLSASVNRHNCASDASSGSLIAYGSSKLVVLWDTLDPTDRGASHTLPGHEGLVTCVKFLAEDSFISADDKGALRCWRRSGTEWTPTASVQAHRKPISTMCVDGDWIATGSSDASVKVWKVCRGQETDELKETQTIPLRGKYPLSIALSVLPSSTAIILAIAGTDRNVQIWIRSDNLFSCSAVLSGHEDWVRSLAFRVPVTPKEPLILASGSQDAAIRLWNIEPFDKRDQTSAPKSSPAATYTLSDELLDAFEASLGDMNDGEEGGRQISLKRHVLTVKTEKETSQFSITFDALLVGHEQGVTSLSWRPSSQPGSLLTLFSTSTDSSLILWSPSSLSGSSADGASSIWINRQRFGDIGGQRLGGFVGGVWANDGLEAMVWGWSGGWRRWKCSLDGQEETWTEAGAVGGHNGPVKSLDWSPNGEYLISAGLDQTTRIHGAVSSTTESTSKSWHEIGRPQVHGYDVLGVGFLDPLRFVSIADEKVARVFEGTRGFVKVVQNLGVADLSTNQADRPVGASVPPLGLSNKATADDAESAEQDSTPTTRRPFEGELAAITLWPEIEKVFGHGYESMSLAVSTSRRLIATACKATTAEHAVVRVYDTEKWQPVGQPLEGHSLTVTRIAFSPDDRYVLSVSRDRTWRLFEKGETGYVPTAADKSHGRIIWDCAWSGEGDVFATASRDRTVRIWQSIEGKWTTVATIKTKEAATAIAFEPMDNKCRRLLAIGLESGEILVYSSTHDAPAQWTKELQMETKDAHIDHIHQLAWRPSKSTENTHELASCSEDGTVKVLIVHVS